MISRSRTGHTWRAWFVTVAFLIALLAVAAPHANAQAVYPPADRAWSSADYHELNEAIRAGKLALPSLADPATKRVFDRMIASDNTYFWGIQTKKMPPDALFAEMGVTINSLVPIMFAYLSEAMKGKPYQAELAKLQIYMLAMVSASTPMMEEVVAKLPRDANYDKRMAGYKQAQSGIRQMVTGIVKSISETQFYSRDSTLEMVQGTLKHLPGMQAALTAEDRQYLGGSLGNQIALTSDAEVKAALGALQTAIATGK